MTPKKNILLFRGPNTMDLKKKVLWWRQKFVEKHGDMNLLDIYIENTPQSILTDCMATGFMRGSRMVIMRDMLLKTEKQIKKMKEEEIREAEEERQKIEHAGEAINLEEILSGENPEKPMKNTDEQWISMLEKIPETNFILFIGNTKAMSELEEWLEENATIHEFISVTPREMATHAMNELNLNFEQARLFCERLGFYEEPKW